MSFDNENVDCDFGSDFAEMAACNIPKTPEEAGYSVVKVTSKSTGNPKYRATYSLINAAGDEGRLLLKQKYRNFEAKYDAAMKAKKSVPVVVFNDNGLAEPWCQAKLAQHKEFLAKKNEDK